MIEISPKYQMKLGRNVIEALNKEYESFEDVHAYMAKWQSMGMSPDDNWVHFRIHTFNSGKIDLNSTIHGLSGEWLIKIAIDLGVETPDFIPSIPSFRHDIKSTYGTANATFEKAFKQVETHPDIAISLANSALEGIIKEILKDPRLNSSIKTTDTLYAQASELLKVFKQYPDSSMPSEIKTIGSSMMSINQSIEKLRSEKTSVHGRTDGDYVIQDSIYAYFVLNSVATVGMYLNSYYKQKFPKPKALTMEDMGDDLPF
jgi:hypothetical protein